MIELAPPRWERLASALSRAGLTGDVDVLRTARLDRYGRQPDNLPAGEPTLPVANLRDLAEVVVRHNAQGERSIAT